jgi:hypothetical protein
MKDLIKYGMITVVLIIIAGWAYQYWFTPKLTVVTVTQHQDSTVAPTNEFNFKPRSTPFESKKTPLVRIPEGVKDKNIVKAIRIIKTDSTGHTDTTGIILMEDGQVLVDNAGKVIKQVDVATYVPPILDWGLHMQVGITVWNRISPAIGIAPLEIEGCFQLPLIVLDYYGIGTGAAYRLKDYSFGLIWHYGYNLGKQIKFTLTYNL